MSRGRSLFFVIAFFLFAFDHDRRLSPVRVRHPRAGEMHHRNDWLRGVGANLGQDGVHTDTAATDLPKWIVDAGRPVDARDHFPAWSATGSQTVTVNTE